MAKTSYRFSILFAKNDKSRYEVIEDTLRAAFPGFESLNLRRRPQACLLSLGGTKL